MRVGIPKEVKSDEYRVGMMPVGAASLVKAGHQVFIEANAGLASGFPDEDYVKAGATILSGAWRRDSKDLVQTESITPSEG